MVQYLELLRHVLEKGERKEDRTGTGTISVFGAQARFDLRDRFPIEAQSQTSRPDLRQPGDGYQAFVIRRLRGGA